MQRLLHQNVDQARDDMDRAQCVTIAQTYNTMAMVWFGFYDDDYQRFLQGRITALPEDKKVSLSLATRFSEEGFD
jgi:hypothetical protein